MNILRINVCDWKIRNLIIQFFVLKYRLLILVKHAVNAMAYVIARSM